VSVAGDDVVVRPAAARAQELHERHVEPLVQRAEVRGLEGLHEDLRAARVQPAGLQRGDERLLERQADRAEVRRVLGLGVDADRPPELVGQPLHKVDDLLERRDLVEAVVGGVARPQRGDALLGPQRLQLGQREVLGEPAAQGHAVDHLCGLPGGELGVAGDVGRARDLVLVAGHEHPILGRDEVGLDVVGAQAGAELVGGQRVLGPVPDAPRWAITSGSARPLPGGGDARDAAGGRRERAPASVSTARRIFVDMPRHVTTRAPAPCEGAVAPMRTSGHIIRTPAPPARRAGRRAAPAVPPPGRPPRRTARARRPGRRPAPTG